MKNRPQVIADVKTPFWQQTLETVLGDLQVNGQGLTKAEAAGRLRRFGPNQPAQPSSLRALLDVLRRVTNPLMLILLTASVVSAFVGELVNATIIALMVVVSTCIDVYQTHSSQQAAERLRQRVDARATVKRDGAWQEVAVRDVVPGDRIRLRAGDIVSADARILEANFLTMDEAAFTGESMPVEKAPVGADLDTSSGDKTSAIFMGTVVASGNGEAVVVHTGPQTAFGHLAGELNRPAPETAFERGLRNFGLLIGRTVIVLIVFVMAANLVAQRPFLDSLLFAIALAVGLTPEFLPMILSITLARGAMRMADSHVIVRQLSAIQNLGNMDVLCSDKTGTLTEGSMSVAETLDADGKPSERVALLAYLNATLQTDTSSTFDRAIANLVAPGADVYEPAGELPFDFERRRLSVAVKSANGTLLVTKGAPESILQVCTMVGSHGAAVALDSARQEALQGLTEDLGQQGFRLLGIASRVLDDTTSLREAEHDLTFEGIVAFSDPVKEGIAAVVAGIHNDGMRLVILTGDAPGITSHVCAAIGLPVENIVTGDQLDTLSDDALSAALPHTNAFARVAPEQKLRLIRLFQSQGHVVGYMGDGINDAPSLRAADVGISVAEAVDIARDAAQIVLLEKSLRVLHDGVIEGRKVFGNVTKYIMMGTSSNFGNMLSMAGAVTVLPFLPLTPAQVLVNNSLYDLAQVTIPTDRVDDSETRKPRGWDMRFVRDFMLIFGPISSIYDFLTFFVLRRVFGADAVLFHTGWFVESLATQTLVIFVIRTAGNPLRSRPSAWLTASVVVAVTVGAFLPFSPLAEPLGFTAPPLGFIGFVAGAALSYLAIVQVAKTVFFRLHPLA